MSLPLLSYPLRELLAHSLTDTGEKLGEGMFSEVFRGTLARVASESPRPVAVKLLNDNATLHEIREECRIMQHLHEHPNIVKLMGYDLQSPTPCIVMELVQGVTLEAHLNGLRKSLLSGSVPVAAALANFMPRRTPALDTETVLDLALQPAQAIAHLHSTGVLHGDIKSGG